MTNISTAEHRLERRIPALSTTVKIRRRSIGFSPWRSDLTLIDLSANGMALVSPVLKLEALQKVDFELTSGRRTTTGCAVVCYAGKNEDEQRYGFLFIDTDAQFDGFLTGESLSSVEVKRLGEEMAEQFMHQRSGNDGAQFQVQNQRMVDAVSALAQRLGQMGLSIVDDSGRVVLPADSLVVGKNGGLSLPMKLENDAALIRVEITVLKSVEPSTTRYQIIGGQTFDNIIDLLDHLCHCFERIAVS
ncbi:MAG: PilZ domain-containing protein [Gammaproteobacteria bacterium]|nr:PilZ domain-containing protein [Gammaproteobacteria bacterium]MBQ0838767.1 PilZ domain-containing protein [Gammaproteobacteria bacterium]